MATIYKCDLCKVIEPKKIVSQMRINDWDIVIYFENGRHICGDCEVIVEEAVIEGLRQSIKRRNDLNPE